MSAPAAVGIAAISFLAGSIPFGYVIARIFFRTDIRTRGSGNIGAMNALRSLGPAAAIAVLVLDALKGYFPPLLAFALTHAARIAALSALCAVVGHCFSPWLRGKGGKGVATSFGAMFALSWPAGICAVAGWLAGALTTSYSSVGSMLGSIAGAAALYVFTHDVWLTAYGVLAALLILYAHRDNIKRLREGRESGIRFLRRRA